MNSFEELNEELYNITMKDTSDDLIECLNDIDDGHDNLYEIDDYKREENTNIFIYYNNKINYSLLHHIILDESDYKQLDDLFSYYYKLIRYELLNFKEDINDPFNEIIKKLNNEILNNLYKWKYNKDKNIFLANDIFESLRKRLNYVSEFLIHE